MIGTALATWRIMQCVQAGNDDNYCAFARDNFNFAVAEVAMKWREWEPNQNEFASYGVDQLINWCSSKNWGIRAHCLFWDVDDYLHYPDWVYGLRGQDMVNAIHHRIETAMPYFQVGFYFKYCLLQ